MDRAKIEQVAERLMRDALDMLETDGSVIHKWILISGERMDPLMPVWSGTEEDKERFGDFLRGMAATGKYDAIAMIAESWQLAVQEGGADALTGSISQHPDRKEIVMVQMSSRHGERALIARFDRAANGKPIRPSSSSIRRAWQPHGDGRLQGFFAGV